MYLYVDRGTWVHGLHPVVRLLGMVAVFIAAFAVERPLWQLPIITLLVALLIWTGALHNVYRLRYLFVLIFVMTTLIWTLFYGPDGAPPLFAWGPIVVSRTAPWFGLGMALKLDCFLASGILFLSVTRIGLPYKVGFTMTMAFRLVPVFVAAAATVVEAQRCRGLDFERGSLWQRASRYVPIMVPVFMGALRRADHMAMTLDARGFQSSVRRTVLEPYRVGWLDVVVTAGVLAGTAAYLALWWAGVLQLRSPH
jgi:energy-coupling factor transport system permease protein